MIEQLKPKSFRLFKTLNGVNMKNIYIPHPKPRDKIKSEKNNNQNNNKTEGHERTRKESLLSRLNESKIDIWPLTYYELATGVDKVKDKIRGITATKSEKIISE